MTSSEVIEQGRDHPRTMPWAVGGIAVTIGLVITLRIGVGLAINNSVHPVTYLAVAGGGLGAVAMFLFHQQVEEGVRFVPIDFWANRVGEDDVAKYQRRGLYLHVTYGAILAGLYSSIMTELTGSGSQFAAFPLSLVTGTVFSVILFVLGLVYARIGFLNLEFEPPDVFRFLASHIVFGLMLGLVVSLMEPLVVPLLGL